VHFPLDRFASGAGMTVLAVLATATLSGCSTEQPRDVNYGTDVGLFYVPPGADDSLSDDAAGMNVDGGDSADSAAVDGGTSAEAPLESAL